MNRLSPTAVNRCMQTKKPAAAINAGDLEHVGVMSLGAALIAIGVARRKSPAGWLLAGVGAAVVARGAQGYKRLYRLVGKSLPGQPTTLAKRALKIEHSIAINRDARDLYEFWRKVENLPKVMSHLISVQPFGNGRSHWVAKAPAGTVVEWDAEIINDKPNELIAWRSLEGSDVDSAGSVHFEQLPEGATRMSVVIRYTPPADILGAKVAKLFGADPAKEVAEDLERFKQRLEVQALI